MSDVGGISAERLKSFIDRIERISEEIDGLGNDRKDIFAEAKATGFDTKILRQILKLRRMEKEERKEMEELLDLYKQALGMLE